MPGIDSDQDLPKLLDTPSKQVKLAKKLATEHLGSSVKRVDKPPLQGMFSRSFFLTLADKREVVLQFRTEPLDLSPFTTAAQALGSLVPSVAALEDEALLDIGVWAYSQTRLPGTIWLRGIIGKGDQGRINITSSLGKAFSGGHLANSSGDAVSNKIRPHLEAILASDFEGALPYRPQLQSFLDQEKLEQLASLPLWVAHYDLNEVNVLVDEECRVTGLVDWELSCPLPFGVGFGRIHTIAGEFTEGEFYMSDGFETAERAFWDGLLSAMPAGVRAVLESQAALVQKAVILGTLLDCFFWENGARVGANPVVLKALPKFLTYRIPLVRGSEGPYQV